MTFKRILPVLLCAASAAGCLAPANAAADVFTQPMTSPPLSAMATLPTLTHTRIAGGTATQYFVGSTSAFSFSRLYVSAGTGSFRVAVPATGSPHGNVVEVDFDSGSSGGLSGGSANPTSAPFSSGTYTFTAGLTSAGAPYTVWDDRSNQSGNRVDVVRDNAGPTGMSVSTPTSAGTLRNGQALTSNPTDGSGSGVQKVEYQWCAATSPCTWGSGTPIASTSGAGYPATWPSGQPDGTYKIAARATDNVNNVSAVTTRDVIVDNTAPSAGTISTPNSSGAIRSGQSLTSSSTDTGSGVESVSYQWCAASSACTWGSGNAIGSAASGSTPVTWTNQPQDGAYKVAAQIVDRAGNVRDTTRTVTVDSTPPSVVVAQPSSGFLRNGQALTASASDATSGVAAVQFRYCATGGGCTFATATPVGSPDTGSPYTVNWAGQPADGSYTLFAQATDRAGNTVQSSRAVTIDNTAPAGGSVDYPDATISSGPVSITTVDGSDAGSGLATTQLERDEAPLTGTTCSAFGGDWRSVSSPDSTTTPGHCYRYRYRVTDGAGNSQTYTSANTLRHQGASGSGSGGSGSGQGAGAGTVPPPKGPSKPVAPKPPGKTTSPLRVLTRRILLGARNRAPVRLRCRLTAGRCRAKVVIYARLKVKRRRAKAAVAGVAAARKRPRTRKIVLGRGSASIKAGKVGVVQVRISRHARRKLLRGKRGKRGRRCRMSISTGTTKIERNVTVKLRKGKRRHKR